MGYITINVYFLKFIIIIVYVDKEVIERTGSGMVVVVYLLSRA